MIPPQPMAPASQGTSRRPSLASAARAPAWAAPTRRKARRRIQRRNRAHLPGSPDEPRPTGNLAAGVGEAEQGGGSQSVEDSDFIHTAFLFGRSV